MRKIVFLILIMLIIQNPVQSKEENSYSLKGKLGIFVMGSISFQFQNGNEQLLEKYSLNNDMEDFDVGNGNGLGAKVEYFLNNWLNASVDFRHREIDPKATPEVENAQLFNLYKVYQFEGYLNSCSININAIKTIMMGKKILLPFIGMGVGYYMPKLRYGGYIERQDISEIYDFNIKPNMGFNFNTGVYLQARTGLILYIEYSYNMVSHKVDSIDYEIYNYGDQSSGTINGETLKKYNLDEIENNFSTCTFGVGLRF